MLSATRTAVLLLPVGGSKLQRLRLADLNGAQDNAKY